MFTDVPRHVDAATCVACRLTLARHDRVVEVHVVAGVAGGQLYVNDPGGTEYAHRDCTNRRADAPRIIVPRQTATKLEHLGARDSNAHCVTCARRFQRGDRIVELLLVEGVAKDPGTDQPAARCSEDREYAHRDCKDTSLTAGRGLVV